jgi:hypothetical protein
MTNNSLNRDTLERLRSLIELELSRRLLTLGEPRVQRIPALLREIFVQLCGRERSAHEQTSFLAFAAPIAREVVLACALSGTLSLHETPVLVAFGRWFHRVQAFDPVCTHMIDLFYFAGLGSRRTAMLVGMSRQAVIRELRFAKAWWAQAQLRQAC